MTNSVISAQRAPVASGSLAATGIRFEFVEDSDGFRALDAEWRTLFARSAGGGFFLRFDWQWRIWTHVAAVRGRRLCILVGRSSGRIVLLWPLMRDRRQMRLLASDKVEYRDLLVERGPEADAWMAAAWDRVRKLKGVDLFLFQDIRAGSNLEALLRSVHGKGWKHDRRSHVIRLDRFDGWNGYADSLPRKMMRDQGRQWRRLAANGAEVRFEILKTAGDIRAGVDWVLRHKLAWLRANGISDDSFGSPEYAGFIRDVVLQAADDGCLLFPRLCVGETIIAAGFGYSFAAEFIFHMFTYDAAWQSYSPSRLLLEHIVRWCFDNGIARFDFMPGEESYKTVWADDGFVATDYLIPVTLRGSAVIGWHASGLSTLADRDWLKTACRYLPPVMRQRLAAALMVNREYAGRVKRIQ